MHKFPLHLVDCILSQHQWPAPILALPLILRRYRGNDDVAKSQSCTYDKTWMPHRKEMPSKSMETEQSIQRTRVCASRWTRKKLFCSHRLAVVARQTPATSVSVLWRTIKAKMTGKIGLDVQSTCDSDNKEIYNRYRTSYSIEYSSVDAYNQWMDR